MAVCALSSAALACAQPYGGGAYGGVGYIEFQTMGGDPGTDADRVKPLSASTLLQVPGQPAPTETRHEAKFKLKAPWDYEPGWGLAGFVWEYVWPPPAGQQLPPNVLPIIDGKFSYDATGRVDRPGIFRAKVGIRRQYPDGTLDPEGQPSVWLLAECAAFGGPIQLGVTGSEQSTWYQIGRVDPANNKANDQPWYIQYFGYTPSSPKPAGFQETQDASAALKYSQPPGVAWEWQDVPGTYSGSLANLPQNAPHPASIDLQAEAAFEEGAVRCLFSATMELLDGIQDGFWFDYSIVGPFVSAGEDDTEQSHYELQTSAFPKTLKMVSEITAAEPGVLARIVYKYFDPGAPWQQRCGRRVLCQLKDTAGRLMPGVLCQERFPEGLPPGGISNQTTGFTWYTLRSLGTGASNGDWNDYDTLWYRWPGPTYPNYDFAQEYWVATGDPATGGVLKRSLTIQLRPGTPGQCNQIGF